MSLSEAQKAAVKARFRKRTIHFCLFTATFWITVLVYMAGADEAAGTWFGYPVEYWGPVVALGALTGMIGCALNLRCPSCRAVYGRPIFTNFCQSCGVALK